MITLLSSTGCFSSKASFASSSFDILKYLSGLIPIRSASSYISGTTLNHFAMCSKSACFALTSLSCSLVSRHTASLSSINFSYEVKSESGKSKIPLRSTLLFIFLESACPAMLFTSSSLGSRAMICLNILSASPVKAFLSAAVILTGDLLKESYILHALSSSSFRRALVMDTSCLALR